MTVFTGYVWTVGQVGEKNLLFQTKTRMCGRGVNVYTSISFVLEFSHQLFFLYSL